jgi:hypothetical protein
MEPSELLHEGCCSPLVVRFGNPQSGWMPLEIHTPHEQFNVFISCTPNDFLLELTTALSLAMQGVEGTALASCEPTTYELAISPLPQIGMFQIKLAKYPSWKRSQSNVSEILALHGSMRDVILPFWRALRNMSSRLSAEEFQNAFHRDFPESCLRRLTELIHDQLNA